MFHSQSHRAALAVAAATILAVPLHGQALRVREWPNVGLTCLAPDGSVPRAGTLANIVPTDPVLPWKGLTYYPSVPAPAWRSVELVTEMVAAHARTRLGARDGDLPKLDSARHERDFRGFVYVVGRRDGSIGAIAPWDVVPDRIAERARRSFDTPGTQLLLNSVDDMARAQELFTWPDKGVRGDSIVFMLSWSWPLPRPGGGHSPMPFRYGAGVAPMTVEVRRGPVFKGPHTLVMASIGDRMTSRDTMVEVQLAFTVDSAGQVPRGSVREAWPDSVPRPRGLDARRYNQFVRDARRVLEGGRYEAAFIGSCHVSAEARQSFFLNSILSAASTNGRSRADREK